MNQVEAKLVISIMLKADSYCESCSRSLLSEFIELWPEHEELADACFRKHFDIDQAEKGIRT